MKIKRSIIASILISIGISGISVAENKYPDSLDLSPSRVNFGINHHVDNEVVTENPQIDVEYGEWSVWETTKYTSDCSPWLPDAKTVLWGVKFIQTNLCEGEEERERTVTYFYLNGDERTEIETEHQYSQIDEEREWVGEKDYIVSQKSVPNEWVIIKPSYSCSSWSPSPSTVSKGVKYTQTQTCKEDWERDVDIFNVWASDKEEFVKTALEKEVRSTSATRSATGTKVELKFCKRTYGGSYIPVDQECPFDGQRGTD